MADEPGCSSQTRTPAHDAQLAQLLDAWEAAKAAQRAISARGDVHKAAAHPYEPFPLQRLLEAAGSVALSEFGEEEAVLAQFGASYLFRWAETSLEFVTSVTATVVLFQQTPYLPDRVWTATTSWASVLSSDTCHSNACSLLGTCHLGACLFDRYASHCTNAEHAPGRIPLHPCLYLLACTPIAPHCLVLGHVTHLMIVTWSCCGP